MNIAMKEAVRDRCVAAAMDAYDDAGIRGLCAEGRWEAALEAMRAVRFENGGEA